MSFEFGFILSHSTHSPLEEPKPLAQVSPSRRPASVEEPLRSAARSPAASRRGSVGDELPCDVTEGRGGFSRHRKTPALLIGCSGRPLGRVVLPCVLRAWASRWGCVAGVSRPGTSTLAPSIRGSAQGRPWRAARES